MSYVLIPRLRINHANAFVGRYAISPAQVMAITLFAHNLARHVLPTGFDYSAVGVAIIHHDAQMLGEAPYAMNKKSAAFHPQQRRGAALIDNNDYAQGSKSALSLQPVATCHLTVSLVVHLPGAFSELKLARFLQRARIAGGLVIGHGELQIEAEWQSLKLPQGYWIIDRSDLLEGNPLDALIAALGRQAREPVAEEPADAETEETAKIEPALPTSWLAPAVLAYAAATDFACRTGVRMALGLDGAPDEIPLHAWGEAMLGLVQYVSQRHWASLPDVAPLPFWYPTWLRDDVFAVRMSAPPIASF
ncbi:type I-F CRISPR-associated protein Csy2 [Amantichitinum ursilacus]|uniref:CRISPR-associated protein n=1 Tax=Amantichitinum ursilacus TaxID=857265 RepID=A0A0N0XLC9_9NEIS|nr:type I-F CRISPR-associated protein Csy2 [Amantichitinum ursilacus]KPC53217.1 CRISPR-associated protein [Amantichitinum ursilacus]